MRTGLKFKDIAINPQHKNIMQAIITKYIPATNFKPSRIKAKCERGSIIVGYHEANDIHEYAAQMLVDKFVAEDKVKYGTNENPWNMKRATGVLPDGSVAHVFVGSK